VADALRLGRAVGAWLALLVIGAGAHADEAARPEIVHLTISGHLVAGRAGQARLTYRAQQANIAAVIQVLEDLDGVRRTTLQREIGVVAAAFGHEEGDLVVPVAFTTPGRKRVVFTLLTDEREESDPVSVELDVSP
jgi:hypothetical protein